MSKGSKLIYLTMGTENNWKWRLSLAISRKQHKWHGSFDFCETPKLHTQKTIHLVSGAENGWGWQLNLNVSAKQHEWDGSFSLADETRKHRTKMRAIDRYWAECAFPRRWRQQFEIHHFWKGGEVCYFLSPEEHLEQDRILREHGLC
jgi:hypothetical protein